MVPSTFTLPDGRAIAYDDVGDPDGPVVVFLHGTPDSRLSRPPDATTAQAGVRLLAVDRPGAGDSDPHPAAPLAALGGDLAALLDALAIPTAILLGWSAGGLFALASAAHLGGRLAALGVVAAVPPVEAYTDPAVLSALGPARRGFVELAADLDRRELAVEAATYLVPDPPTPDACREHVLEGAGPVGRDELAAVPGALDAVAAGVAASVEHGRTGLVEDLWAQLEPGLDLSGISVPVRAFHGGADEISPPAVGAWLIGRLPNGVLDLSPKAGHHLLFPHWRGILRAMRRDAGC